MKIIRQINNNAALALDGNGKELVVLGRGVGFPKMPYELTDPFPHRADILRCESKIFWHGSRSAPPAGAGLRRDHGAG